MSPQRVLLVLLVYVLVVFGGRSWLQYRRSGSTGFRGLSGRAFSVEWWGGVLLVVGLLASLLAPLLALLGAPLLLLPPPAARVATGAGSLLLAAGFVGTVLAQLAMGPSWRIGVDPSERTALITHGPFRLVRNPIFTSMLLTSLAVCLLVPGPCALGGFAAALLGLELQVRVVEEPYLLRAHPEYAAYAARVGRFVPGLGRLGRR